MVMSLSPEACEGGRGGRAWEIFMENADEWAFAVWRGKARGAGGRLGSGLDENVRLREG